MAENHPPTSGPRSLHPSDELLTAYLTTGLSPEEERTFDAHTQTCDTCIETLQCAQRRIASAEDLAVPVPDSVAARLATPSPVPRRLSIASGRLTALLRLPVLVPVAVAAGVLLALTVHDRLTPATTRELIRSVPLQRSLRVTAAEVLVRSQPTARADVLAKLSRGTRVAIRGEERDWYRVVVPDGPEGWVERRAFD